jgi:hypothetical protein
LKHKLLTNQQVTNLQTDSEGKVVLGHLPQISQISSTPIVKGDISAEPQVWVLDYSTETSYPSVLRVCEGDSVNLPYFEKELNSEKLSFTESMEIRGQKTIIRSLLSSLKLKGNSLEINDLREGLYFLNFLETSQSVRIQVFKGKFFFIYGINILIRFRNILEKYKYDFY